MDWINPIEMEVRQPKVVDLLGKSNKSGGTVAGDVGVIG